MLCQRRAAAAAPAAALWGELCRLPSALAPACVCAPVWQARQCSCSCIATARNSTWNSTWRSTGCEGVSGAQICYAEGDQGARGNLRTLSACHEVLSWPGAQGGLVLSACCLAASPALAAYCTYVLSGSDPHDRYACICSLTQVKMLHCRYLIRCKFSSSGMLPNTASC